jgi:hypothetical protein
LLAVLAVEHIIHVRFDQASDKKALGAVQSTAKPNRKRKRIVEVS